MEYRPPAPPPLPRQHSTGTLFSYVPLLASFLTIPWFMSVVFAMIKSASNTLAGADPRAVGFVAALPAGFGLLIGIIVAARGRARRGAQTLWLALGCAVCGLIVIGCAGQMLR